MTTTDNCEDMISWNVVGDLPGSNEPDQMVILGCHYDGHDISQGAGDPASGAVAVLEAGRVLAKYAPGLRCTIRFALWGVEEIGLLGSRKYVKAHAEELSNIRFYLNMDAAGTSSNNRDIVLQEWPDLAPFFERCREEMALDFALGQLITAYSDHFPFFLEGVPTGCMQSAERSLAGRGYGHSQFDTVDKVDLKSLREASVLSARLALRIASEDAWSTSRRDKDSVLKLLDTPEYRAEQEYRARVNAFYREASKV
jgi:Zn-dependent M28 family amino/carboxypeptidase